ncbi:MAG TPA: hypothetical protein VG649_14170, partial [Candidatus Angelobacter sp.]|nr:hypothetical protein [Candidatus Angelobacter sp.]
RLKLQIFEAGRGVQGLKPNVTYFATRTPAMCLIYTSCGLRETGFWRKNRALPSCLLILRGIFTHFRGHFGGASVQALRFALDDSAF